MQRVTFGSFSWWYLVTRYLLWSAVRPLFFTLRLCLPYTVSSIKKGESFCRSFSFWRRLRIGFRDTRNNHAHDTEKGMPEKIIKMVKYFTISTYAKCVLFILRIAQNVIKFSIPIAVLRKLSWLFLREVGDISAWLLSLFRAPFVKSMLLLFLFFYSHYTQEVSKSKSALFSWITCRRGRPT